MLESLQEVNLQRARAHDVADYLAQEIGRLEPGTAVGTKHELRQRLSVSAGTMNEAVRLLQDRGIVVVKTGPKGGLFAASPDPLVKFGQLMITVHGEPTAVQEAEPIRNALEPLVVTRALRDRTKEDIADLRKILATMAANIDDAYGFLMTNWDLHIRIAECGDGQLLKSMYLVAANVIRNAVKDIEPEPSLPKLSRERLDVHVKLVDCIESRDEAAALRMVALHEAPERRRRAPTPSDGK